MCGICGKINSNGFPVERSLIEAMTTTLSHRGPDDSGLYFSEGTTSIGLGHRRLSIVDLSKSGQQPMSNEDGSIILVFNGEIYNHAELRQQLLSKGHRFKSQTDSETIIHLYEESGIDQCLHQLNGMFAFALWDARNQSVYLCRDRAGIKPLVYSFNGSTLTFASEIRSLLLDKDISTAMDQEALNIYLTLNYIPAPYTIYKNIRKLEPASYIQFSHGEIKHHCYWDVAKPSATKSQNLNLEETSKELYKLLEDAVRLQCSADVPLGAFLSGGLDSGIIVALMSKTASSRVKTFSVGYSDMPMFDETSYARLVSQRYNTDHTEIILNSRDMLGTVKDLLHHFDEPFADSSAIPTFCISQKTRQFVKVALSGDGGDEIFAGYRMYDGERLFSRYQKIPALIRQCLINPLICALPDSRENRISELIRRSKKFISASSKNFEERFFLLNQIFQRDLRRNILHDALPGLDTGFKQLKRLLNAFESDSINRMLYCDFKYSLPNDMLTKVDLMSMRNALEVRVPLLDHRIAQLMFSIPGNMKMTNGQGKSLLRQTFKDLLPQEVLTKPKTGFEVPIGKWLKTDLNFLIHEHLSKRKIESQGIFHYDPIENLIEDLVKNRRDTSWQLWNLIVFQAWREHSSS